MNKKTLWTAILAVYIFFIYFNSMQPAVISSGQSGFVLTLVQNGLAMMGFEHVGITEHIIRKTAHFTEYAFFGAILVQNVRIRRLPVWEARLWTIVGLFLVPFVDETIQLFVEGRSGQVSDVWLDMAGAACAVAISYGVTHRFGIRRKALDGKKL